MPSYTENLGLPIIGGNEGFDVGLINDAMRLIDAEAGRLATGRAARNWLDNSNFMIDQRGKGTYTATGYSFDRWRFRAAGGGSVTKLSRGIRLTVGAHELDGMYQRIATQDAPAKFDALAGRPITLAVQISANALSNGSCGIDLLDHNGTTTQGSTAAVIARKNIPLGGTGIFVATGIMPESMTYAGITALFKADNTGDASEDIVVDWMALYEGTYTADTLPIYVEREISAELLECQRYYTVLNDMACIGHVTSSAKNYHLYFAIPTVMRAVPSVVQDFSVLMRIATGGYSALTPGATSYTVVAAETSVRNSNNQPNLHLIFSVADAVDTNNSILEYAVAGLALSADL